MDNALEIGVTAVLDPHNMTVGQYVVMEGHLFAVSDMSDESKVFLRPVIGRELYMFHIKRNKTYLAIAFGMLLVGAIVFYFKH